MIEIELKYRVTDNKSDIVHLVTQLGFKEHDLKHQIDAIYLPSKHKSFATFTLGEPVARVRSENGKNTLTVKKKINSSSRIEHEIECGDFDIACQIIETLGYRQIVMVDKQRRSFTNSNGMTLTIDDVKNLGEFVEIEILEEDAKNETIALEKIKNLASQIGLDDKSVEAKNYDELLSA